MPAKCRANSYCLCRLFLQLYLCFFRTFLQTISMNKYSYLCINILKSIHIHFSISISSFLDRCQPRPIKSVLLVIFCMKLGDYKGRKVTEPDFWEKLLTWKYSRKGLQISPKSDTFIFFSKTALMIFLVFGLKLVLNMTFNLNETYFSEKITIWRCSTSKSSKKCPNWGFWPFSQLCIISFPRFCT